MGVPKTIDNDLSFIESPFFGRGFQGCRGGFRAHVEAHDAVNGIAVIKLMRESGL